MQGMLRSCGPAGTAPFTRRTSSRAATCRAGGRVGASVRVVAAAKPAGSSSRPTAAETARTMADIAASGTLSVQLEDGWPVGANVSFVLDDAGQPILCVPAKASFAAIVAKNANCSLHVQPTLGSTALARATFLGVASPAEGKQLKDATTLFGKAFAKRYAQMPADSKLYQLSVKSVLVWNAHQDVDAEAETVTGEAYKEAQADPLSRSAAEIVRVMNEERVDDLARFCASAGVEGAQEVAMLSIDKCGFDARAIFSDGLAKVVRIPFSRTVEKEQDALSQLTMLAQQLWEQERQYRPADPVKPPVPAAA